MYVDVGDLYRIGPGPSSSRTVGPMLAARRFAHALAADGVLGRAAQIKVELYGGVGCTGREVGTDAAIVAGLSGLRPEACDREALARCAARAAELAQVTLDGRHAVAFVPSRDVAFCVDRALAYEGNAIRFHALDATGGTLAARLYFSVGGGDVVSEHELGATRGSPPVPYPFESADTMLALARARRKKVGDMALANACVARSPGEVRAFLTLVAQSMRASIERGLVADGALPGGAPRRAPRRIAALAHAAPTPAALCSVYATAVAEENACGGRIVAAPSSGAAGPVAALLRHFGDVDRLAGPEGAIDYLVAAAAIGGYLRGRGLAQAGCQSEIGVAAAMAAAGYAAASGGSNEHVLYAAELALEPHSGLACDSDGARVQAPCIDRNASAAARAIEGASEALRHPQPRTRLDAVADRMIERGRAMAGRFKQASLGGVAVSVPDC